MADSPSIAALRVKETKQLKTHLQDPFADRILVYGDPGSGRRSMITAALQDYDGRIFRVVCSSALMDVPLSTLAPILGGDATVRDELDALRRVKTALSSNDIDSNPRKIPLLVMLDAEFLDTSSAFVLGQLVDAKLLRLLMVSTLRVEQSESLGEINSSNQLRMIDIGPLDLAGIAHLCQLDHGLPLTSSAALAVYGQCFGNVRLTRHYLDTARQQQVLFQKAGHLHLRWYELVFQPEQALVVQQVHQQLPPEARAAVETLAFVDRMSSQDFSKTLLNQHFANNWASVVQRINGSVRLSPYYAAGLRASLPMARREEIYETFSALTNAGHWEEYAHLIGNSSEHDLASASVYLHAARAANDSHRPNAALRLLHEIDEEDRGLEEHVEAIRAFLTLFQPEKARSALLQLKRDGLIDASSQTAEFLSAAIEWSITRTALPDRRNQQGQVSATELPTYQRLEITRTGTPESTSDSWQAEWDDQVWIDHLQSLHEWWGSGELELLARSAIPERNRTLVPSAAYQLASIVKRVQALTVAGDLDRATEIVSACHLGDSADALYSNGTVEFLYGLIAFARGEYRLAGSLYSTASVQLTVHDPESLLDYCNEQLEFLGQLLGSAAVFGSLSASYGVESTVTPSYTKPSEKQLMKVAQGGIDLAAWDELATSEEPANDSTNSKPATLQCLLNYLGMELGEEEFRALHRRWLRLVPGVGAGSAAHIAVFMEAWLSLDVQKMRECIHLFERLGHIPLALNAMSQLIHRQADMGDVPDGGTLLRLHRLLEQQDAPARGVVASAIQKFGLTHRERIIVELLRAGASNSQIAGELTLSQRTVEGHVYRIFQKLSIGRRSEFRAL